VINQRSKHIDVKHHFIREVIERGDVRLGYISSEEQLADALTKTVPKQKFLECRHGMGVMENAR
jgi:hypothetical protein